MSPSYTREQAREISWASNRGERVVHLYKNDCYYAHLALYRFALEHCRGRRVFDAGCGTGYGSDYLMEHGATRVDAIDYSADAVDVCRRYFQRPGLSFRRMDATRIAGFPEQAYDVVYSSNCLEHVPSVPAFLRAAHRLLTAQGLLIVAVPPIVNEQTRQNDLSNPWHLNCWTPRQWQHTLGRYFTSVQPYRHLFARPEVPLDFLNFPDQCVITEADFSFVPCTVEEMVTQGTLTALFLARTPRPAAELPAAHEPVELVDESTSRPAPRIPLSDRVLGFARRMLFRLRA